VAGSFAQPIVLSYAIAVAVSTVVALAVTPALASLLLRGGTAERTSPALRLAHRLFDATVARLIGRPRAAYATLALLLAVGLAVVPQLTTRAALPTPQDRNVLVRWQAVPGTSLTEMDRITTAASAELRHVPGVRDVGAHVGRALASDEVVDVNAGEMWVSINDSADYDATLAAVRSALHGYPGLASQIESYTQDRVDAVTAGAGTGSDLAVRVYGTDLATLRSTAQRVSRQVARVNGVVQPKVLEQPQQPTLEVEVDLSAAQKYGLAPGDVRRAASTFFAGTLVGSLYQDQRIFDVTVWSTPSTRYAPANLADLMIDTPAGPQVRLGDVASVKVVPYPTQLRHDASSRYAEIDAQIGGRDVDAVLRDVRSTVAAMPMPLEYHAEVLSQLAQQQGQDRTMAGLALGTAIVIFLLLQAAFGSWRLAALASLMLPLSLAGGVAANLLAGGELSLAAMLGLFTVLGLTARHVVVLIAGYRRIEALEGIADRDAVLRATRDRVGPILLTAAATAAVFLPVLVAGSRAGTEVLYPMAAVVLGGLVSSTLVSLVVVPSLYLRFSPAVTLTGRRALRSRLRPRGERVVTSSPMGEG
jgi:Cu/Ag efflux pump CusA